MLVVGLIAGIIYLKQPKHALPAAIVPANNTPNPEKPADLDTSLFGEVKTVPQVKAEALKLGQYMTEQFPKNDSALFLLGSVYGQQGDIDRNVALWKQVIGLNPTRVDVYDKLAQLAKDQEETEQALAYWQRGLKVNPRHSNSLWALANTYLETHQPEKALDLLEKACSIDPKTPRNYYSLAQTYQQLQRFEDARVQYEKAIELNPDYVSAYYGLALTYRSLKQTDQAKTCLVTFQALKKAHHTPLSEQRMSDDYPQTLKQLARYYYRSYTICKGNKQVVKGLPLLMRAIVLDPANTYYLEMLGVYFSNQQQFAQAISVFQKARAIDPSKPLFGVNIGKLYSRMKQPAQAERLFMETISGFSGDPVAYAELTRLYLSARKNLKKTVALAQKAVTLQPSAAHYYLLAVAHQANRQYPSALQAVQEAMVLAPTNANYRMLYEHLKGQK